MTGFGEADFDCDAYGPEGREVGALCFFAGGLGERVCISRAQCVQRMDAERRRLFTRIQKLAAAGDPVGLYLAGSFTDPGQLLGGGGEVGDDEGTGGGGDG